MKKIQKVTAWLLAFVMVLTLAPAGQVDAASKVNVKKVTVSSSLSGSKKTVVVAKGKKVKLTTVVSVTPNKSANKKVTYTSQDKKIATVDSKGNVKGVKAGSTKITVTSTKNKKKKATIAVKVMKGAVTKVTLDQTSGTLNVGDSIALKATVKAKSGANKTVAWTSSNNAVVTVNSKGQVTAVGAGSASVTAKAIDGSGKKATYKVTVNDPRYLTAMSVVNSRSITFSLNKPLTLQASDIIVKKKAYQNGAYQNTLVIDNISTTDSINYSVVLSGDSAIYENEYVQLSIPGLTGSVKSMEAIYTEAAAAYVDDEVVTLERGEYYKETFRFYGWGDDDDYYYYDRGYSSFTIENLPAGLTAESKNSEVIVKGVPTAAGVSVATLKAVDELGNTLTKYITFAVYADDAVVAAATDSYITFTGDPVTFSKNIRCAGGSESYTFTVISDPSGLVTNKNSQGVISLYDGDDYCYVGLKIAAAGEYAVTVRVQDKQNPALYCDAVVKVHVMQGITIGGCVLDGSGNKIPGVRVSLVNKDKASRCQSASTYTDSETGVYGVAVLPGTYDITVSYSGGDSEAAKATKYLYSQTLSASQTGFDIQLPLYKVTIAESKDEDGDTVSYGTWYYDHESVGSGTSLYLKAGNYTLKTSATSDYTTTTTGDWFNGITRTTTYNYYEYVANVSIVNSSVQVGASKATADTKPETHTYISSAGAKNTTYQTYADGDTYWVDSDSSPYYAYYFIPETTGSYSIEKGYTGGVDVKFYDANGTALGTTALLTAGTKYYVATGTGYADQYFTITRN